MDRIKTEKIFILFEKYIIKIAIQHVYLKYIQC